MIKKLTTLAFVFMLAFYPVTSASAASVDEETDTKNAEENNIENADDKSEDADGQEADKKDEDSEESVETDSEEKAEDESDSQESEEKAEDSDKKDAEDESSNEDSADDNNSEEQETNEEVDTEEQKAEDSADEDAEEDESEKTDDANSEAETTAEEDEEEPAADENAEEDENGEEDFNIEDIHGTASGDITYDVAKGYYVLDLQAGFSSMSLEDYVIKDKWVAFALPNGVRVAEELPRGMVQVTVGGKTGLAVKIPNINGGTSSEYVHKDVALTGAPDDNDPYMNLNMLDVDTENNTYDDLGEVKSQRDIDFSVMEENPSINLSGSIDGTTEFDKENIFYYLNLTVEATNSEYDQIDNLYAAFELPEGVQALSTDETPEGYEQLNVDGKTLGAVKLPKANEGDTGSKTYSIPVIGKTDAKVNSDSIQLYTINNGSYNHVGNSAGNINIDYSNMNQAWHFTSKSEVITDYPGVNDNQKGFRFNYEVKNLTVDDVDKVVLEFVVPNSIDIEKPQYIGGNKIDWDGNTATVDIGDLRGGSGYHGYFTAVGSTALSLADLKDAEVNVTLFKDGKKEVKTIQSPFVEGKYDEADFDNPPEDNDGDNGDDNTGDNNDGDNGDDNTGDNNDGDNGDDNTGDNNEGGNGDDTGNNNDDDKTEKPEGTNDGSDNNKTETDDNDSDVTVEVEDGNDDVEDGDQTVESDTSSNDDGTLPNTATNNFTMIAVGLAMLAIGGVVMIFRRKTA